MQPFLSIFVCFLLAGSVLAIPDELEKSYQSLKAATANKDVEQVKKLAAETSAMARKVIAAPEPAGDIQKENWKRDVAYAADIDLYTEYALYALAVQSPPETLIELVLTLEKQNPKSKYMDEVYGYYFAALARTGAAARIVPSAEKALAIFPDCEDTLLVLADDALSRQQPDKAAEYAARIIAVLSNHPKPETLQQDDWDRKKGAALGRAYFVAGVVQAGKNQYMLADQSLRNCLPYVKDNEQMLATTLFQLGVMNYNLGKSAANKQLLLEGAEFSDRAARIPGPYAQSAANNARAMRAEALKMGPAKK
jgi:hypothetical protein